MPNFNTPDPTPEYLHFLVGSILRWNTRKEEDRNRLSKKAVKHEVLEKAVRMWYVLSQAEEDLNKGDKELKLDEWIRILYRPTIDPCLNLQTQQKDPIKVKPIDRTPLSSNKSKKTKTSDAPPPIFVKVDGEKSKLPIRGEGRISSKKIPELLFYDEQDREEKWIKWKKAFLDYQKPYRRNSVEEINEAELDAIEPFYVVEKTIKHTLESLVKLDSLIGCANEEYFYNKEKEVPIAPMLPQNNIIDSSPSLDLGEFESYFKSFGKPIEDIQRFYIREDYQEFDGQIRAKVKIVRNTLKNIWKENKTVPIEFDYHSSSKGIYKAIAYPVAVYYNQRAFYLCAYGGDKEGGKFDWHNYRIDRIQSITKLESDNNIPVAISDYLQKSSDEICDKDMTLDGYLISEKIESPLQEAYGFDFYLKSTEMILRFNRDFHDRYIKNTFRHRTFEQILTEDQFDESIYKYPNLKASLAKCPNDAYYKIKYRINDNTVIMRLRAWGHNVEVISPPDLRKRIYDDMQKAWDLYN